MVLTDRQSVAANASVANALSGKLGLPLSRNSIIRLYATASAVGLNMTLTIGSELVMSDQEVNAQNRMPIVPDDFIAEYAGLAGDNVFLAYRNTTAGAITGFSRVEIIAQ